jgi:hypothetical protein
MFTVTLYCAIMAVCGKNRIVHSSLLPNAWVIVNSRSRFMGTISEVPNARSTLGRQSIKIRLFGVRRHKLKQSEACIHLIWNLTFQSQSWDHPHDCVKIRQIKIIYPQLIVIQTLKSNLTEDRPLSFLISWNYPS